MPGAWDSKQPHWTRTGALATVLIGVLGILVSLAVSGLGNNGPKSALPNSQVASPPPTSQTTSTSPPPPSTTAAAAASISPSDSPQQPFVPKSPTRTAATPLSLDIKFDKWGQVGPATWQRKCCSFRITTLLSDQFGDMSGADQCWVTITLLLNGTQPTRTINGVCGDGWADAYKGLEVGTWVLRFQATSVWGQSTSVDRTVTIVPATQ